MLFLLYDYVNANGKNEFRSWTEGLQPKERIKLNQKLDALAKDGDSLFPHLLTSTGTPGILKLRLQGNPKLRPLLCRGPVAGESAFTLLAGAREIGWVLKPAGVESTANSRKSEVIHDPANRRRIHERIAK